MKVYNTRVYWKCVIKKSLEVFSEPFGLKYDQYCQGYIHFSNRRHTKKVIPSREKVLALEKQVRILKKKSEY